MNVLGMVLNVHEKLFPVHPINKGEGLPVPNMDSLTSADPVPAEITL